jgi:hypothetical protein
LSLAAVELLTDGSVIVENIPEQRRHGIVVQAYPGLTHDATEGIKWGNTVPSYDKSYQQVVSVSYSIVQSEAFVQSPDGRSWSSVGETAANMLSRNYVGRLITRDNDAALITSSMSAVSWSIQSFLVSDCLHAFI